jgi:hypothetical protein
MVWHACLDECRGGSVLHFPNDHRRPRPRPQIKRAAAAAALPVSAPSEPASNQFNRLKSNKQEVVVIPVRSSLPSHACQATPKASEGILSC